VGYFAPRKERMSDQVYYAIGDVHCELQKLDDLLRSIREDAVRRKAPHRIVFLGDLIDRGPDSRRCVERAMSLMQDEGAAIIRGNHEELMLHAFDRDESIGLYHWATNGGDETIASYERVNGARDHWREAIDPDHVKWLRTLPSMLHDEERRIAFVHGGIDPKTFPECTDEIRLWTRSRKFFDVRRWPSRPELTNLLVVHGHTPTDDFEPDVNAQRINVDTGACFGGPLTAAVLGPGEPPRFLYAH
jgi:serine/threonine protein phosphatase 1